MKAESQRNILALAIAQAILDSQMPMYIILEGLVGQRLASNVCYLRHKRETHIKIWEKVNNIYENAFILVCSPYCLQRCRYFELLYIININWCRLEFQFHWVNKPANKKSLPFGKGESLGNK